MKLKQIRLRPDWLTIASALLYVVSFPPWNQAWIGWFCLVPWFWAVARARDSRDAFVQGLWLSVIISVVGFYWVGYVLHEFAGLPWPLASLGLLGYSLVGQPQLYLFSPVLRATRGLRLPTLPVTTCLALAYAGLDWILPKLFVDTLGHSLYASSWLIQAADLGGAALLTFAMVLVNLVIYELLSRIQRRTEPSVWPSIRASWAELASALILVLALLSYGRARLAQVQAWMSEPGETLQAAVIQANIGDFDKIASERGVRGAADKVLNTFYGMSDQALQLTPRPEILVWPETSYPSTFRTPEASDELARDQGLEQFVRTRGATLFFGGYDREGSKDFNAFFFLAPAPVPGVGGEGDLQVYRKNILLLWGEYIPGAESFEFIRKAFPQVGNFGRGPGPVVLKVPYVRGGRTHTALAGPVICYEILFPNYVIGAARQGAQFIVNITNDSWFGPWGEPELHLSLTAFRSIETRLPQLRSTNTGISTLILPDGRITRSTALFTPEILNVGVPLASRRMPTLMTAWGDWFGPTACCLGFGGLCLLLGWSRRRLGRV
jgi:apolipoprotein N-acyltransferase